MTDYPITYENTAHVARRRMVSKPLFGLGRLLASPAALDVLEKAQCHPAELLQRHQCGDWGDVCVADASSNDEALVSGARLVSAYKVAGIKLLVVTEAVNEATQRRDSTATILPAEW